MLIQYLRQQGPQQCVSVIFHKLKSKNDWQLTTKVPWIPRLSNFNKKQKRTKKKKKKAASVEPVINAAPGEA